MENKQKFVWIVEHNKDGGCFMIQAFLDADKAIDYVEERFARRANGFRIWDDVANGAIVTIKAVCLEE